MDTQSAVLSFIQKERSEGKSDKEIQHDLLDAGWQMDIIQKAMGTDSPSDIHILAAPQNNTSPYRKAAIIAGAVILVLILLALFI